MIHMAVHTKRMVGKIGRTRDGDTCKDSKHTIAILYAIQPADDGSFLLPLVRKLVMIHSTYLFF